MEKRKLSASAISTYLKSPKQYYWRYVAGLESIFQCTYDFSHDRILGSIWSEAVDRFYKGSPEKENTERSLRDWREQTDGWLQTRTQNAYTAALESWLTTYHQEFHPKDGVRNGSEKLVENDRFMGYLDGLSADHRYLHECKATKRSPQLAEQLWYYHNSIQVKLYAVITRTEGVVIELAFKDNPPAVFRAPVYTWTQADVDRWEREMNHIADVIEACGDNPDNYVCNPNGCCIVSKGFTSMCQYSGLCDMGFNDDTKIFFKEKTNRRVTEPTVNN